MMNSNKTTIEILKKVQLVDNELFAARLELEESPGKRKEIQQSLEMQKSHLGELESGFRKLQLKQKEKEGELAQKEMNVRKLDGQLGQLKTNKEYTAMQQEIASLKADNSLLEEDIIKVLDEIDAAEEELKKERIRVQQIDKEAQVKVEELAQKEKVLSESIEKFRKQREEILVEVPSDVRDLYNRIIDAKQGVAVAKAVGECCGACSFQFRPQIINDLKLSENLVICENCARILYIEE